jgi:hypothetical protein
LGCKPSCPNDATKSHILARERLRDFKLRSQSPEDYADSTTSRALFTKEWNAMLGLCGASWRQHHPRLIFVRADPHPSASLNRLNRLHFCARAEQA